MKPHVVVVGSIGAGKSTILARLSPALGVPPVEQGYEANPFLTRFYADPPQWAFRSQLWFTAEAIARHARVHRDARGGVQEQSVRSTHAVMTTVLHDAGHISDEEHATLGGLVEAADALLPAPALVLAVRATTDELLRRIEARGRPFERGIDAAYLEDIDAALSAFLQACREPVMEVDTERLDVRGDDDLAAVVEQVREALAGGQAAAG